MSTYVGAFRKPLRRMWESTLPVWSVRFAGDAERVWAIDEHHAVVGLPVDEGQETRVTWFQELPKAVFDLSSDSVAVVGKWGERRVVEWTAERGS